MVENVPTSLMEDGGAISIVSELGFLQCGGFLVVSSTGRAVFQRSCKRRLLPLQRDLWKQLSIVWDCCKKIDFAAAFIKNVGAIL